MSGKQNFESLLEYIVNGEQAKAEELFHQLVVAKSREIYENILEDEMKDEEIDEASDEEEEESVEESSDDDEDDSVEEAVEEDDDEVEEMFNFEADDDEGEDDDAVGGDGDASDMGDELGPDGETDDDGMEFGDHDEEGEEPTMMDLKSDIEELKDMFAQMLAAERHEEEENPDIHGGELDSLGGDEMGMDDMGGEEDEGMMMPFEEEIEAIDLSPAALMREYVDKIGGNTYNTYGKMGDNGANTKSIVAGKNDMGGTSANIVNGGTESSPVEANKGQLKGSPLPGLGKPKDMNTGNVNKPGGTNVKQFYKNNSKGHGAEKKGAGEVGGTDKKSLLGK